MGRVMLGREAAQEVKQPGKLAAVIPAPFRAERSHFSSIKSHIEKSLNTLARLEERAAEKKPSIREALATHNEKIAQAQKDAPPQNAPALSMQRGNTLRANLARSPPAYTIAISGRKGGISCRKILNAGRLPYLSMLQN